MPDFRQQLAAWLKNNYSSSRDRYVLMLHAIKKFTLKKMYASA
jgi:hypothetical protein